MIRDICKDEFFLSQKAEPATADDLTIAQDLLDTLTAHMASVLTAFEKL
jgi:peptide deformylase